MERVDSVRFTQNISLRHRLLILTMSTSSIGLLAALAIFLLYNQSLIREHKVEELHSAADLIGTSSAAALVLDDPVEGTKLPNRRRSAHR
jgi:hypothetical protein